MLSRRARRQPPAPLRRRFLADAIDVLVVAPVAAPAMRRATEERPLTARDLAPSYVVALLVGPGVSALGDGRSLGQRIAGVRIIHVTGARPGVARLVVRDFGVTLLSAAVGRALRGHEDRRGLRPLRFAVTGADTALRLFSAEHRGLGDWLARTRVVRG